jgi:hypothetical protein
LTRFLHANRYPLRSKTLWASYLPGTRIKTSPTDVAPLEQLQMMRFKGETWELFGPVTSGEKNS